MVSILSSVQTLEQHLLYSQLLMGALASANEFFFFNLFAVPQGVWDLSPLTSAPALAAQSINH